MRYEVTRVDELPRGHGLRVSIGDHRIALFRVGDEVYAIGDRCSHAEASLSEGEIWDGTVECPRHGSEFDLESGEALSLPATRPVPVYDVAVIEGTVFLEVSGP